MLLQYFLISNQMLMILNKILWFKIAYRRMKMPDDDYWFNTMLLLLVTIVFWTLVFQF